MFNFQDIAIGGWQLKLKHSEDSDADEVAHYKFHRSLQLKAGSTCTVSSHAIDVGISSNLVICGKFLQNSI